MKRVSVDTQIIILDYSKESTVYKLYYEMAESSDGDGAGMAGYWKLLNLHAFCVVIDLQSIIFSL